MNFGISRLSGRLEVRNALVIARGGVLVGGIKIVMQLLKGARHAREKGDAPVCPVIGCLCFLSGALRGTKRGSPSKMQNGDWLYI